MATAKKKKQQKKKKTATTRAKTKGAGGKYVYGIIGSRQALGFGPIGINVGEVHTLHHGDLAAIVSDTAIDVCDPTRENLLAHERVNEAVLRDHTVLPLSFGTVFKSNDDVIELLRAASGAFRGALGKMDNKLEFGLKVLWEPTTIIKEIEPQDENARRLKRDVAHERGLTDFARMAYEREIFGALRDVCVASRASTPIGDKMVVNGAFLVARDREADFDACVRHIGNKLDQFTLKYTGPWPPYHFINIRLQSKLPSGRLA